MDKQAFLAEAENMQPWLVERRRTLHRHPETGFDLPRTLAFVREELEAMGYAPESCGKAGLVALVGGTKPGKTILLRADMDALPLKEAAEVPFASEREGVMHACGHDLHAAMLLGAAKLLKDRETELCGTVKLMFQPAEEIFRGAADMVEAGVLDDPVVDGAVMIHVNAGQPISPGTVLVPEGGVTTVSCQQYHIIVRGRGGHGSTPHLAVDPITAAAHIHLALQEINSRELDPRGYGVFTTCCVRAGETANVIPETAEMWGTVRTADPAGETAEFIKRRMTEIARGVGEAMRCEMVVEFGDFCPCVVTDKALAGQVRSYLEELFGSAVQSIGQWGGGSEDFSHISLRVPSVCLFLGAGDSREGYEHGLHNPRVTFDESVLWRGSAAYAAAALGWLDEQKEETR